jgi:flavin prenyltransferase
MNPIVLGITGASGAIYSVRLLEVLLSSGQEIHLIISPSGAQVMKYELGLDIDLDNFSLDQFFSHDNVGNQKVQKFLNLKSSVFHPSRISDIQSAFTGKLIYSHHKDFMSSSASGSFLTAGMVICPCSMGTLSSIAGGISNNLLQRAADVHLKEKRKLILVPRETPLSPIHINNMKTLSDAGAIILPAMPGFYDEYKSVQGLIDFIVARICDQLGVPVTFVDRWGSEK